MYRSSDFINISYIISIIITIVLIVFIEIANPLVKDSLNLIKEKNIIKFLFQNKSMGFFFPL